MSRDINPFGLRMPAELRARLEQAARDNGRSLNAELLSRLEASLEWEISDSSTRLRYDAQAGRVVAERVATLQQDIADLNSRLDEVSRVILAGPRKAKKKPGVRK